MQLIMDESEINQKTKYVEDFKKNIVRSMNIKIKISNDRIEAIKNLEVNPQDPNALQTLKNCVKNERWLLRIIENGLSKSSKDVEEVYDWIKKNIKDKELKKKTGRVIEIVMMYYSNLKEN